MTKLIVVHPNDVITEGDVVLLVAGIALLEDLIPDFRSLSEIGLPGASRILEEAEMLLATSRRVHSRIMN